MPQIACARVGGRLLEPRYGSTPQTDPRRGRVFRVLGFVIVVTIEIAVALLLLEARTMPAVTVGGFLLAPASVVNAAT